MKEIMQKLIESKPMMSDIEKDASMSALSSLKQKLAGKNQDKLKGLQKVSVMSNSPEGLKTGLEKAEDIVEKKGRMENSMPDDIMPMEEEMDSKTMILSKAQEMSPEDLDECIKSLMELKEQKMGAESSPEMSEEESED